MITEHDLHEAIAECQGERNPNAQTCIKLASYYTILREMDGRPVQTDYLYNASADPAPSEIAIDSTSEFAECINGRNPNEVWPILDELMQALSVVNPRLYAGVIRKLRE